MVALWERKTVCLWTMDPRRRPAKNTSHGNEVLLQDTTHLIQKPFYWWGSLCLHPAGSWTTWRSPDHDKERQSGMDMSLVRWVWRKPSCKAQWKGEEDKADRRRGGQTTSENGQAWSSLSPRGQWRTKKNGRNWLWSHLWCPTDPFQLRDRWSWTWKNYESGFEDAIAYDLCV